MSIEDEDREPLSPVARVFQSPGNDCCIIIKIGCKFKINADVILRGLKLNVSKHPRFSSKLSDGGASWIKTQVNVENHVFVPDIDPNKIGEDGEGYVQNYVSRLTTLPLDKSRPLWDIHILNVKTSDAEAVYVIRSHHSLGDGTSLVSLLVACTQKTSHWDMVHTIKRHNMVDKDKLVPWILRLVLAILSSVRLIWKTFVDFMLLLATAWFLKDTKTPLKGDVGVENKQKKFCHRIVSLDDIKFIKEVMNMTIMDVLLGVTQAALSRYLSNFPDMMAKDSKCRWGNYFSSINYPISIGLETDPLSYLSKAKSAMDQKKHSLQAALAYSTTKFIFNTFGAKVGAILPKRLVSNTTTFISNMIGPLEEINFHGYFLFQCQILLHTRVLLWWYWLKYP